MTVAYKRLPCCLLAVLTLCALLIPAAPLQAQAKPVLVISISGVEALLSDIAYITEAAGMADFGRMAAMMSEPYTKGIDKTRPVGIVITADNSGKFAALGFVPVTDLQALLGILPRADRQAP